MRIAHATVQRVLALPLIVAVVASCGGSAQAPVAATAAAPAPSFVAPSAPAASAAVKLTPDLRPVSGAKITYATSSLGGLSYLLGTATAGVLGKYMSGSSFTALVSSGSVENARRIQSGEFQCGSMTADVAYFGFNNGREFTEALPKLRFVSNLWVSPENIVVVRDSPIKTLLDLKGKRITSTPGWGATTFAPAILEAAGLAKGDYQMVVLSGGDGANALRDGTVDAAMWAYGIPTPTMTELASSAKGLRFLPVDPATGSAIRTKFPYWFVDKIPSGSYQGVTADVPTVSSNNVLLCSSDIPDNVVYNIAKVMYLYGDEIKKSVPAADAVGTPAMAVLPPIKVHSGAEAFYREAGFLK